MKAKIFISLLVVACTASSADAPPTPPKEAIKDAAVRILSVDCWSGRISHEQEEASKTLTARRSSYYPGSRRAGS